MNEEIDSKLLKRALYLQEQETKEQERIEKEKRDRLIAFQSAIDDGLDPAVAEKIFKQYIASSHSTQEIIELAKEVQKRATDEQSMMEAGIETKFIHQARKEIKESEGLDTLELLNSIWRGGVACFVLCMLFQTDLDKLIKFVLNVRLMLF